MSGIFGKLSFDPYEPLAVFGPDAGTEPRANVRAVADARITNAASLRAELTRLGHAWQDESDAELLAHAYAEWGASCVMRLRGAFACAIWDERQRRLILARDHMGIRPLYFALLPDTGLLFASEIRDLLADPRVSRAWSAAAIDAYLALGYIPAPLTPFERITKLEPAQMIVVEGRRLRAERYWEPQPASRPARDSQVADVLAQRLEAAVRRELRAGGVTGILYSGGAASTTLLAVAPRAAGTAITVVAEEDGTELTRSHAAAACLGHARELETVTAALPALAAQLAAASGEPLSDPGAVLQLAVGLTARRRIGCALGGHGATVLWGGGGHRQPLWDGFHRREIYTRGFAWDVRDAEPWSDTFVADSVLAAAHHASTIAGLDLRFPFLELDLVQLALAHASARKPLGNRRASTLQQLLARRLPRPLLPQPAPAGRRRWLESALVAMVPSYLMAPRFDGRGIVSRPALRRFWNEHRTGRCDHAHRLWSLVMLECWFREFVDDRAAGEPLEYAAVVRVA